MCMSFCVHESVCVCMSFCVHESVFLCVCVCYGAFLGCVRVYKHEFVCVCQHSHYCDFVVQSRDAAYHIALLAAVSC